MLEHNHPILLRTGFQLLLFQDYVSLQKPGSWSFFVVPLCICPPSLHQPGSFLAVWIRRNNICADLKHNSFRMSTPALRRGFRVCCWNGLKIVSITDCQETSRERIMLVYFTCIFRSSGANVLSKLNAVFNVTPRNVCHKPMKELSTWRIGSTRSIWIWFCVEKEFYRWI